ACSTEPQRASGRLRRVTLVAGTAGVIDVAAIGRVRKLLSLRPAKFRLKPRKLLERKTALRTSELVASPKESAKARRKVSEERWLKSVTKRQPPGNKDWISRRCCSPP